MESDRIQKLVEDVNAYLGLKQEAEQLWDEVEMHLQTSYIAEYIGDADLVPRHLYAVARLLGQAHAASEMVEQNLHSSIL